MAASLAQASWALDRAAAEVCRSEGEPIPPVDVAVPPGCLAGVAAAATRLYEVISSAKGITWSSAGPGGEGEPAEVLWLALHDVVHHLEDAKLLASARERRLHPTHGSSSGPTAAPPSTRTVGPAPDPVP
jgi:hypothetical protein